MGLRLTCPYPDRAADEASSVVNLQDSLEQLVLLLFVSFVPVLYQIHRLGHASREIHESVGRVAPIQSFVAPVHPGKHTNIYIYFYYKQTFESHSAFQVTVEIYNTESGIHAIIFIAN